MNLGNETKIIEFKNTIDELEEGIISLSSMLNKHKHGTLYFGVKDNGDVVAQEIGKSTLRDISQAIANAIKPQCIPTISVEFFDPVTVIRVSISGNERPYSAYGKYYIRSADEDRELSPTQLKELMLQSTENTIVNIESRNQDLKFSQIKMLYLNKGLTLTDDSFIHNLNFLTDLGKFNILADLLSDENDYSIKVARFNGNDKTELVERNEYGYKCLLVAMEQVLTYVDALNSTVVNLSSHQREEIKLFDSSAFREAWINACLHNKWAKQIPPALYIYNDRIEIVSTGSLPSDFSKEEFYRGISRPVNSELQKIMGQLRYVEQTGHGVPLIVQKYGKEAFTFTDNFIIVTIPFSRPFKGLVINDEKRPQSKKEVVYNLIKNNPSINTFQLMEETNLSESGVYKIVNQLKKDNLIIRNGSRKKGVWETL